MKKIKLQVPATTANIGPGFDSLGCAFNLYNYYTFQLSSTETVISGCPKEFCNKENLSYIGYAKAMEYMGLEVDQIEINIDEFNVPVCRGLGSSATMIAAGVYAANALHGYPLGDRDLLKVANNIEGHPDNVAPALFGGFTASFLDNGEPYTIKYEISTKLKFCAISPSFELSTSLARSVLPVNVPHKDAVFNVSRLGVLLKALENADAQLISLALADKLHQPFRKELILEFDEVKSIANSCGSFGFFISGAGPTLMTISFDEDLDKKMEPELQKLTHDWTCISLQTDFEGVKELVI